MPATVQIEGLKEFIKAMDALPDKLQRQTILPILRKSGRPVIRAARGKLKGYGSGYNKLAKSIGNITAKSKHPIIYIGPRVKGKWSYIGYYAHWVEYGTTGIKGNNKGTRSWKKTEQNTIFAKRVGTIPKGGRYRSDQPARPFMRPAIDANMQNVASLLTTNFHKYLDKQIQRQLKKLN